MSSNIVKIIHIADIHIHRNNHTRIRYAWQELLELIKGMQCNANYNIILVIAGDIFEDKVKVWAEDLKVFRDMMSDVVKLNIECILVPGNHDVHNGIDLISNVLDNHPCIHLMLTSDMITIYNCAFVYYSIITNEIPKPTNGMLNIAIVHETISSKHRLSYKDFDDYHVVLCGDLHEPVTYGIRNHIAYSGSFIQKNRGENLYHGCIVWTIDNQCLDFKPIEWNDNANTSIDINTSIYANRLWWSAYDCDITIYINNDKYGDMVRIENDEIIPYVSDIKVIKPRSTIVKYYTYNSNTIKLVESKYGIITTIIPVDESQYTDSIETVQPLISTNEVVDYLSCLDSSHDLIELDKSYNANDISRCIWTINYVKWSNIFKYAGESWINFADLKGIGCISGPNAIGKSSVISILCAALFYNSNDGIATQRKLLINNCVNSDGYIICSITIGSDEYIIHYHISSKNQRHDRLSVYLNGCVLQEGDKRIVREKLMLLLGSKSDFLSIPVALQSRQSILDMPNKQQTEYFRRILGITPISDKVIANDEAIKSTKKILAELAKLHTFDTSKIHEYRAYVSQLFSDRKRLEEQRNSADEKYKTALFKVGSLSAHSKPVEYIEYNGEYEIPEIKSKLRYYTSINDLLVEVLEIVDVDSTDSLINELSVGELNALLQSIKSTKSLLDKLPICKRIAKPKRTISQLELDLSQIVKPIYGSEYCKVMMNNNISTDETLEALKYKQEELLLLLDSYPVGNLELLQKELSVYTYDTNLPDNIEYLQAMKDILGLKDVVEPCIQVESNNIDIIETQHTIQKLITTREELKLIETYVVNTMEIDRLVKLKNEAKIICEKYPQVCWLELDLTNQEYYDKEIIFMQQALTSKNLITEKIKNIDMEIDKLNADLHNAELYHNWCKYNEYKEWQIKRQKIIDQIAYMTISTLIDSTIKANKLQSEIMDLQSKIQYLDWLEKYQQAIQYESRITMINSDIDKCKEYELYEQSMQLMDLRDETVKVYETDLIKLKSMCGMKKYYTDKISEMSVILDTLENNQRYMLYKQYLEALEECTEYKIAYDNINAEYTSVCNNYELNKIELEKLEAVADDTNKILQAKKSNNDKLVVMQAYADYIGGPNGLLVKITKSRLEQFCNLWCVNLAKISDMSIQITLDRGFNIDLLENGKAISIDVASGYQKFALDLTFRDTAMQLAFISIPSIMIIDEGFGAADYKNKDLLKSYIIDLSHRHLMGKQLDILVVSHIEEIHTITSSMLNIEKISGGSRLRYGTEPYFNTSDIIRTVDISTDNHIQTVDEFSSNKNIIGQVITRDLYCQACNTTLSTTKMAERHLASKTHNTKFLKWVQSI